MIVRWVHPKKVEMGGKLKPAAFPIKGIMQALNLDNDGKCSSEAISLNDFNLLTSDNKEAAKEAACKFCGNRLEEKHIWPDGEGCDCEDANIGARGAIANRQALKDFGFCAQADAHSDNLLHALLCACANDELPELKNLPVEKIQKILRDMFSNIHSVESIFANCSHSEKD